MTENRMDAPSGSAAEPPMVRETVMVATRYRLVEKEILTRWSEFGEAWAVTEALESPDLYVVTHIETGLACSDRKTSADKAISSFRRLANKVSPEKFRERLEFARKERDFLENKDALRRSGLAKLTADEARALLLDDEWTEARTQAPQGRGEPLGEPSTSSPSQAHEASA